MGMSQLATSKLKNDSFRGALSQIGKGGEWVKCIELGERLEGYLKYFVLAFSGKFFDE
jgi:hypothetical protein